MRGGLHQPCDDDCPMVAGGSHRRAMHTVDVCSLISPRCISYLTIIGLEETIGRRVARHVWM